jgi:hypothetical protein
MKTRSTTVGLALAIGMTLALVVRLQALSVGDIVVQSRRGAPFLAEIPLTLTPPERPQDVAVELGKAEEYRAEGLSRPEVIDQLEVSLVTGARDVVLVASTTPIRAPAFDLVMLVRSGQVTIVRTYHVALSVPSPAPPQAATPAPKPPQAKPRNASPPATTAHQPRISRAAALPAWAQNLPKRYGPVPRDRTLYSIAEELGVPKKVIWQTIVVIWQANKSQFAGGNLHGLRSGVSLIIPSDLPQSIAAMEGEEAQRLVAEQWEAWQALQRAVSDRQSAAPSYEETAVLTEKPEAPPPPEPAPAVDKTSVPSAEAPTPSEEVSAPSAEAPVAASTVVLPAEPTSSPAAVADLQTVLQGLEGLLAQRLVQPEEAKHPVSFVSSTDLQVSLQGLEDRLTQRLQQSMQQVAASQMAASQTRVEKQNLLEQMLPANSMVYVLVLENALLLLLAAGILWRWLRSRA